MKDPEKSTRRDSRLFGKLAGELLHGGTPVRFRAEGVSMRPNLKGGELVTVEPLNRETLRCGDIVLTRGEAGFQVHRVITLGSGENGFETRGDAGWANEPGDGRTILGRVTEAESDERSTRLDSRASHLHARARRAWTRLCTAAVLRVKRIIPFAVFMATTTVLALACAAPAAAQADLSMTQSASPAVVAPGGTITYTEVVTNLGPNAAVTAVLYQQTPPNTTFASVTPPTGWTCTAPAVGATGSVTCTDGASFAINSPVTFTFIVTVAAGTAAGTTILNSADVTSTTTDPVQSNSATTTSVLVETAGQADLEATIVAAPTPVFVSSTLIYTIQIQNLGLAGTADGTLTDTLPTGVTFFSATSTQGSCLNSAGMVTCTLGAIAYPLATPITVTITVTTPLTATTLTNTASISSTTTDPVSSNNSATAITVVQPLVCATPGKDGAGDAITGIVNAYYSPASSVGTLSAGSTSVALGAAAAGGAQTDIAAGDLLLFIQMQDAAINSTNTSSYGHGVPGEPASGWTNLDSSGEFEFVTAASAVSHTAGGTLTFVGTGASGGLLNTYYNIVASAAQGQQTFQIIRVPQYTSATLGAALTAMAWNGATGGVLAVDVASQLMLNSATVSTNALGFRGGGGRMLTGGTGAATDYLTLSTDNTNGSKGEGIAGTPHYLANATITALITTNQTYAEGLPNGSYARGAPGNAGGGATDAHPAANDQNSGGGGGGNGGAGGNGGFGWHSAGIVGGFGGAAFPASTGAMVMGGGGGAGTTNNGTSDPNTNTTGINSSGAAGGAIIIIHAGSVTGTGTITSNGQTALNVANDGGGGGGAGGSIRVLANSGGLGGLTVQADGGKGGNTWSTDAPGTPFPGNRHGPGGGGGGGAIFLSGVPASSSIAAGLPGYSTTAQDAYGAVSGSTGYLAPNASASPAIPAVTITQAPGTQPGAYCASADLAVTNSGAPNPVAAGSNITYTQKVTNNGPLDALNAVFNGATPANTTFVSMTAAAGWTCSTLPSLGGTGNIICTNPDVANSATGTFTLVVAVNPSTTFGAQVVDVASVTSGTNDSNLANNIATAVNIVGSTTSANLSVTISASPSPVVQAGNNITYTIVAQNLGPAASSSVAFTDPIPANTTFVSASTPAGWSTCAPSGGTISCSAASMASNATATFTVVLNVTAATPSGTIITNYVTVSGTTPDPNPTNNTAQVSVTVASAGQADLSVTSSASPNPVLAGNNISYAQTVTNNGPASVTNVTFTDTVPTNTTFVSLGIPAGWTCPTIPTVGGTGNISCCPGSAGVCSGASVTSGTAVNFPLVVKVNATTAPKTAITNTANVAPTTNDPNTANNSATTTVYVASPTEADVAIRKTASPEPVDQGTNLAYTIQVTNNGPAVAQGVTVSDPIPAEVTYVSASTTQGTCSQSAGTVTCNVGTLSVGGLAIITINVTATSMSSTKLSTNTATVTATTDDPNSSNNSSSANSTIQYPTAVQIASMRAMTRQGGGVVLEWRTREEVRNLGFYVFREDAQGRHQLNPSLIAGSALFMRGGSSPHNAKTYQWLDTQGGPQFVYWIEDVDLNGTRAMHGPVYPDSTYDETRPISPAPLLRQLDKTNAPVAARVMHWIPTPRPVIPILGPGVVRVSLDSSPAVKISVREEGWYSVSRSQLVAAGLDPGADARMLQLYAEGIEQPMLILGRQSGPLGPNDSIEFYGTGIDTPFSDTRVYWLVKGLRPGQRIPLTPSPSSGNAAPPSFPFTVLLEQRTTYFAALLNGENADNFFGALVTTEPVDQELTVVNSDPTSDLPVTLDVALQGVTDGQDHRVEVALNGTSLGEMDFSGMAGSTSTFPANYGLLHDGTNTVTLTALEGDNDVSLVQSIALHYAHTYTADSNWLRATASQGTTVRISGFTNPPIHVFDITNPLEVTQLVGSVQLDRTTYGITVTLPGYAGTERTLLAFSDDQISSPAALSFHAPSLLAEQRDGADIVIITHPDFAASLAPLANLRESQGHEVTLVRVDQLFDAFNYGERSPFAIRDYLQTAATSWRNHPQAVLLAGDASLDPRNYLGFGDFDFVPTRIIETAAFKTASDDWFTDFRQSGFATIPTGRLPIRTAADATLLVSKIVNYDRASSGASWAQQALFIADQNIGADFTTMTNLESAALPASLIVTKILADGQDPTAVRQQILAALNNGALLVNYTGHGSEEQWSFADLLDDSSASSLANGDRLPVYFLMDCLNGFFHDVYATSLSTSLLLAPKGGAVAVWASSGFTNAPPQATMDQALLRILAANPSMLVGSAILKAKSGITDQDVRRTWILFGDPTMHIAFPLLASQRRNR